MKKQWEETRWLSQRRSPGPRSLFSSRACDTSSCTSSCTSCASSFETSAYRVWQHSISSCRAYKDTWSWVWLLYRLAWQRPRSRGKHRELGRHHPLRRQFQRGWTQRRHTLPIAGWCPSRDGGSMDECLRRTGVDEEIECPPRTIQGSRSAGSFEHTSIPFREVHIHADPKQSRDHNISSMWKPAPQRRDGKERATFVKATPQTTRMRYVAKDNCFYLLFDFGTAGDERLAGGEETNEGRPETRNA